MVATSSAIEERKAYNRDYYEKHRKKTLRQRKLRYRHDPAYKQAALRQSKKQRTRKKKGI